MQLLVEEQPMRSAAQPSPFPAPAPSSAYADYVNPEWVRLLEGRVFLDFLSGYCVPNTGHNHSEIIAALKRELDPSFSRSTTSFGKSVPAISWCSKLRRPWSCLWSSSTPNVTGITTVIDGLHSSAAFWSDALDLGRRAFRI